MPLVKHILFPIDFSERCRETVPYVAGMAKSFGAKITLLHVVAEPYWYAPTAEAPPVAVDVEEIRRSTERDLSQGFAEEFAGLTVEHSVEIGDPAQIITQFAENHDVDLVMMPTHGYGPFRQFLLGSVTAKVLHDCKRPVWTSAHLQDPPQLIHLDVSNVLCAIDVAPNSVNVLKVAAQFAQEVGAQLRLVHAVPGPDAWPSRQLDAPLTEALIKDARRAIDEWQKSFGVSAPLCVIRGSVASAVHESAARHTADLVVIGRGVLKEILGRLRTNAYAIIRQSPCPVLSV